MSAKKKTAPKKKTVSASTKKTTATKTMAPKKAAAKKAAPKKAAAKKATAKTNAPAARRADYGSPVDGAFAKAPAAFQPLLATLRELIAKTAPKAEASLKWGQPFYMLGTKMLCGIGIHKNHVNVIFSGPPGTFVDPKGLLAGDGKTGRHLKLAATDAVPAKDIQTWLKAAAAT